MRQHIESPSSDNIGRHTSMRYVQMLLSRRWLIAVVLCALVVSGCATDKHTAEMISHAESIVKEHPDSALRVVQSIDPSKVRGKHDRAHFQLIVAEAHYYNRLTPDSKTTAQPLFDYYFTSDCHDERARAMYQYALVMQKEGKNAEAMFALMEAEESLSHRDNPHLWGLVHRTKGDIYGTECLFQNALEEYKMAEKEFNEIHSNPHVLYNTVNIGSTYRCLKDFNQAKKYLTQSIQPCIDYQYYQLLGDISCELALIYIEEDDMDKCREIISMYDTYNCISNHEVVYYYTRAITEADNNNVEKAILYMDTASKYPNDIYTDINYLSHIAYKKLGCVDRALEYITLSEREQDSLMLEVLNTPILKTQIELLEREQQIIYEKAKLNKVLLLSIIVTLVLVVIAIILYTRYRHIQQSRDIANYINTISELRDTIKTVDVATQVTQHNNDDFSEINKLCEIYYQYGNTTYITDKIANSVIQSIESIRSDEARLMTLERIVNIRNNNILIDIKDSCIKLNNKEYRFIVYFLLGFTTRSIAVLLNIDTHALSRLKYKVKAKLNESDNEKIRDILT